MWEVVSSIVADVGLGLVLVFIGAIGCFFVFKSVFGFVQGPSKRARNKTPAPLPAEGSAGAINAAAAHAWEEQIESAMKLLTRAITSLSDNSNNEELLVVLREVKAEVHNLAHAIREQASLFNTHGVILGRMSESIGIVQEYTGNSWDKIKEIEQILTKGGNNGTQETNLEEH